jgi:hypothetical protein
VNLAPAYLLAGARKLVTGLNSHATAYAGAIVALVPALQYATAAHSITVELGFLHIPIGAAHATILSSAFGTILAFLGRPPWIAEAQPPPAKWPDFSLPSPGESNGYADPPGTHAPAAVVLEDPQTEPVEVPAIEPAETAVTTLEPEEPMTATAPPPVAKTTPTSLAGAFADEIVATLENPSVDAVIDKAITSGEMSLEDAVDAGIKNLPSPGGVLALFLGPLESAGETYAAQIVAKYPAATIRGWLVNLAAEEAVRIGG